MSMVVGLAVLSKVRDELVNTAKTQYMRQQTLLADQIAETLGSNIVNLQNQLRVMATMPEVQNIDDVERCNSKLGELLAINQKQLGNLARTDTNGLFACSVNQAIIGQDTTRYGSYVRELIDDPNHAPVLGRNSRPTGVNTLAIPLHVPVYESGVFRGTLGGAMYFNKFQDEYLSSIKFGHNGHVVLMDDNGDIMYHPSDEQNGKNLLDPKVLGLFEPQSALRKLLKDSQQGKSGTINYSVASTQKMAIYKTFRVPDMKRHWTVIATIPVADLENVVNQSGIDTIFTVLVTLFAVTIALLTFVSLRIIHKNQEVQAMKDDFISITSHQLRTPATIVKQNLGIIKEGYATSKKDVKKFIDSAYESNENQLSVIENILSVSKLEAGRLEVTKESVILQDIVGRLADNLKMNIAAKKHTLSVQMPEAPIYLQADPLKINMAIENLVSNAVKYTPAAGKIKIIVSENDGWVQIAVKDNGRGIGAEDIPKLFMRFNRLRSAINSHVPGTGLGLYLTKKIVELHGGTIGVTSRDGSGSTFTIKLPKD